MAEILDELVGSESFLTVLAVHKRIGKSSEMSAGYPCLRVHKYGAVKADIVSVVLDKFFPPCFFDIVLKLHSYGAVIPCI